MQKFGEFLKNFVNQEGYDLKMSQKQVFQRLNYPVLKRDKQI